MRPLLALVLLAVLAAPANAGTYEHRTLPPGLDGWSPGAESAGGFVAAAAEQDRLSMRFWARPWFAPGERAEWVYTAAADTTIAGWDVQRAVTGVAAGDWNTLFGAIVDGRWHHVAWDVPSVERPWGRVGGSGPGAARVVARLACGGPHVCGGSASMELRTARMTLHDPYAPVVSAVQGELAEERVLSGSAGLSFAAADRGGGVYRALAEVDGRLGEPVAIGDGRCRDAIAGGDPYQFAHRRPCPAEAGATVAVDTATLSEGRHVIAVHVEDAAGNRTTAYGPAVKTVDNTPSQPPAPAPPGAAHPAPPGAAPAPPAAAGERPAVAAWLEHRSRRRRAVTVAHDERVRLRGRVTDAAGRPVAGAAVDIAELTIDGDGRPLSAAGPPTWRPVTGVRARADGRFTAFARVGPSRRLRISSGRARPVRLTVRVRAPLAVRVRGRRVRGRLLGGRAPRGGALVEIQVRHRRRWATALVVRTYRSGRFAGRLRRAAPARAVRVRVPRQAGLPYATGLARPPQPSA